MIFILQRRHTLLLSRVLQPPLYTDQWMSEPPLFSVVHLPPETLSLCCVFTSSAIIAPPGASDKNSSFYVCRKKERGTSWLMQRFGVKPELRGGRAQCTPQSPQRVTRLQKVLPRTSAALLPLRVHESPSCRVDISPCWSRRSAAKMLNTRCRIKLRSGKKHD